MKYQKIHPVGAGLFHTDRWTYMLTDRRTHGHNEVIATFSNFAQGPKIKSNLLLLTC